MYEKFKKVVNNLDLQLSKNEFWNNKLKDVVEGKSKLHLAIFVEPYLSWLIDGTKTIESRFSKNKCAPFQKINDGDIILIKRSGGDIEAVAVADKVWSYNIIPGSMVEIKDKFGKSICAEDVFWESKKMSNFASLIKINIVQPISPIHFAKRDRRGWVILN